MTIRYGCFTLRSAPASEPRESATILRATAVARCLLTPLPMQAQPSVAPQAGLELEPEMMLPSQFYPRLQIDASLQPEKRLMLAVLEEAVGTFQKYAFAGTRQAERIFSEAEEWFSSDDVEWPYAFRNICDGLGLEAGYIRSGLASWKARQRARHGQGATLVRFPFRRVNGTRHAITGRPVGLRHSA